MATKTKQTQPDPQGSVPDFMESGDLNSLAMAREKLKNGDPHISKMILGPAGVGKSTMVKELVYELQEEALFSGKMQKEFADDDPKRKEKIDFVLGVRDKFRDAREVADWREVARLHREISQKAWEVAWGFKDIRLAQSEAIDLKGYPVYDDKIGAARWVPYVDMLPFENINGRYGIFFLDEFNQSSKDVQKAAYQLVLDRSLGGYEIPDGWILAAAGNRKEDVGVMDIVEDIPIPLKNRFMTIEVSEPKTEEQMMDMRQWMHRNGVAPIIISYLKSFPQAIYDTKNAEIENAWPSPRSWTMLSRELQSHGMISASGALQGSRAKIISLTGNCVGKGRAAEFEAYSHIFHTIPDASLIIEKGIKKALEEEGKTMPKENESDRLYALCTSVNAHMFSAYKKPDAMKNYIGFISQLSGEFRLFAMQEFYRFGDGQKAALVASPEFQANCKDDVKFLSIGM